ncbi:MAG: Uma2 family endonuclease [Armatimonadetes bacterium]|nr:Uma2 family endonuclease [Armatimonadota bacterium]
MREKLILTYQNYLQLPSDRNRYEILGGDLYVTPSPSPTHQSVVMNLGAQILAHVRQHSLGRVLPSPVDVILSQVDVVQTDLVFVSKARAHIITDTGIQGPPDLVIEILSPTTARVDRGRKMETYARSGVAGYWIVDPDTQSVEVYTLEGGQYRRAATLGAQDTLTSPNLPGLTLPVSSLWE